MTSDILKKILTKIVRGEHRRLEPQLEFSIEKKTQTLQQSVEKYRLRSDVNRELLLEGVGAHCSALATVFGAMAVIEHSNNQPQAAALMDRAAYCHLVGLKAQSVAIRHASKIKRDAAFGSYFNEYPLMYAYCKAIKNDYLEKSFESILLNLQPDRSLFTQADGYLGDMSLFYFIMGNTAAIKSPPFREMHSRPDKDTLKSLVEYHYRRCFYRAVTKGPDHEFRWTPFNYFPTEVWLAEARYSIRCSELDIPRMAILHGDYDRHGIDIPPIVVDLYDELVRDYGGDDNAR